MTRRFTRPFRALTPRGWLALAYLLVLGFGGYVLALSLRIAP